MKNQNKWIFKESKITKEKVTDFEKIDIMNQCQPLVELFKSQFVKEKTPEGSDYLVDVYTKWNQNYLYFCEKYISEHPNRIKDEYEKKFVRLEWTWKDKYNFSFFRHTGHWFVVANNMPLKDCLEMMQSNPNFQPIG